MIRKFFMTVCLAGFLALPVHAQSNLWQLATNAASVHRFATLFIAQDVLRCLSTDGEIDAAIEWCKSCGVTHVYLEEYRDGYKAERETLERARDRFRAAGFLVSGCVTTTLVGKPSTGWGPEVGCFTDRVTQERLQALFEYAASMFDEIIVDDYFFSDCQCEQCDAARKARTVTVGDKTYPVAGDSWGEYHRALMLHVSQDRVLAAARKVNPKVRLIIKYPQWYDMYQERGYDVGGQSASFDKIYAGTETRDYTNEVHWGHTVQYEGYFLMRWLGEIGGEKTAGGWYDSFGTTPPYYIEQARQTILGGARESFLFCYGTLDPNAHASYPPSMPWPTGTGPVDVAALRTNIPELLSVAGEVRGRQPIGVAAYKPLDSYPGEDARIYDYMGMIGLPLVPCHLFPTNAPAAFFSLQALQDTNLVAELRNYIKTGRPVLITDALDKILTPELDLTAANVRQANLPRPLDYLLVQPQSALDDFRAPLLAPFNVTFSAPDMVGLYLFSSNGTVVENFNDRPVSVTFNSETMSIPARGWVCRWK